MINIFNLLLNNKWLLILSSIFLYLFITNKHLNGKVESLESQLSAVRYELVRASEEADKLKEQIRELALKAQELQNKQQELISQHEEDLEHALEVTKKTACGSAPLDDSVLELLLKPHD